MTKKLKFGKLTIKLGKDTYTTDLIYDPEYLEKGWGQVSITGNLSLGSSFSLTLKPDPKPLRSKK